MGRHVADNYHQAPQKCQYAKVVGAVCEMNGDEWGQMTVIEEACCYSHVCVTCHTDRQLVERSNVPFKLPVFIKSFPKH